MPVEDDVPLSGGGAANDCLNDMVTTAIERSPVRPSRPQGMAAIGCALRAFEGPEPEPILIDDGRTARRRGIDMGVLYSERDGED